MIALLAVLSFADSHEVRVQPSAVTVFADRARATRTASVQLGSGRQDVVFVGLPVSMLGEGVTADVSGGQGVLRGIDLRQVTAAEAADKRVHEIEGELEKLADQRQAAVDESTAAQVELAAIANSRSQAAEALSRQLMFAKGAPAQTVGISDALDAEETQAREKVRVADVRRREIDEKIAALQRERDGLGSSSTDTFEATVHLDVKAAGKVSISLDYLVYGASWQPRYDVRGDAAKGKVEIALAALVTQTTGEDWDDVKLSVSSANPSVGTSVPVLDPFWLQRPVYYNYAPAPSMAPMAESVTRSSAMREEKAADFAPTTPMVQAQAQVSTQLAATTFSVERSEDIPSDGSSRKVLLTTIAMDADLRHIVVPRVDARAYLVGKVSNKADFPLLAGTAGVFLSGSYLGDMQMALVPPGESFDVAFGVDDRVTVTRTPRDIKEGKSSIVGKRATSRWSWQVDVKNSHSRPIHVLVREQMPISTQQEVKVEMLPASPVPDQQDNGILEFDLSVQPGAKGTVTWGYTVEYPEDLYLGWME